MTDHWVAKREAFWDEVVLHDIPDASIYFKDEGYDDLPWYSYVVVVLGVRLLYRLMRFFSRGGFTKDFDKDFITVFGGKQVYFPSRERYEDPEYAFTYYVTLRHEYIHMMDRKRYGIWFSLFYLFPFTTVVTTRAYWEYRGYAQNLICYQEYLGKMPEGYIERVTGLFRGGAYFFMDSLNPKAKLAWLLEEVEAGRLTGYYPEIKMPWKYWLPFVKHRSQNGSTKP